MGTAGTRGHAHGSGDHYCRPAGTPRGPRGQPPAGHGPGRDGASCEGGAHVNPGGTSRSRGDVRAPHTSNVVALDAASVEAIARRVADLLRVDRPAPLVDAQAVAERLGISRATVYAYASLLGATRVGNGLRPRLRFDVDRALAAWTSRTTIERSQSDESNAPAGVRPRRATRRMTSSAHSVAGTTRNGSPLLPLKGPPAHNS